MLFQPFADLLVLLDNILRLICHGGACLLLIFTIVECVYALFSNDRWSWDTFRHSLWWRVLLFAFFVFAPTIPSILDSLPQAQWQF
ncbi:MAG: hypothetical protein LUC47_00950 [Clostridiales bacterium]|nr:hypothetical protein [Clostridiales bacterium]